LVNRDLAPVLSLSEATLEVSGDRRAVVARWVVNPLGMIALLIAHPGAKGDPFNGMKRRAPLLVRRSGVSASERGAETKLEATLFVRPYLVEIV
jgi:hypothetical protein